MSICLASLVSIPERIKRLQHLISAAPNEPAIHKYYCLLDQSSRSSSSGAESAAMDRVERIFIGTAIIGFLVMAAAIVWMMTA